jgi:hypothetical protein
MCVLRVGHDFVAHQLLAIVIARLPRDELMQALFDGVGVHATRLLEDADATTRVYLGLGGALGQLALPAGSVCLCPCVCVLHSNRLNEIPLACF